MNRGYWFNEDLRDVLRDQDLLEEIEEERARLAKAPTLPAPPPGFTRCAKCGASYDYDSFRLLERVGVMPDGMGGALVLRNCAIPHCHGTTQRRSDDPDDVDEKARDRGEDEMAEERAETERAWREGSL